MGINIVQDYVPGPCRGCNNYDDINIQPECTGCPVNRGTISRM